MHLKPIHAEHSLRTLHHFIRDHPLAIFTTALESGDPETETIQASHIPWVLDTDNVIYEDEQEPKTDDKNASSSTPHKLAATGSKGVLRGHIALANPQAKSIMHALQSQVSKSSSSTHLESKPLLMFNHPIHSYISPTLYTATGGKRAPTWNYAAVQVYGKCRIYHHGLNSNSSEKTTEEAKLATETETDTFLTTQLSDLASQSERSFWTPSTTSPSTSTSTSKTPPEPWTLSHAPKPYISTLKKAIIGLEIEITHIAGRFKMSQELAADGVDRGGVVSGFERRKGEEEMARWVREKGVYEVVREGGGVAVGAGRQWWKEVMVLGMVFLVGLVVGRGDGVGFLL